MVFPPGVSWDALEQLAFLRALTREAVLGRGFLTHWQHFQTEKHVRKLAFHLIIHLYIWSFGIYEKPHSFWEKRRLLRNSKEAQNDSTVFLSLLWIVNLQRKSILLAHYECVLCVCVGGGGGGGLAGAYESVHENLVWSMTFHLPLYNRQFFIFLSHKHGISTLYNSPVGDINQHFNLLSGLSLFSPPPHWRRVVDVRLLLSPLTLLLFWLAEPSREEGRGWRK